MELDDGCHVAGRVPGNFFPGSDRPGRTSVAGNGGGLAGWLSPCIALELGQIRHSQIHGTNVQTGTPLLRDRCRSDAWLRRDPGDGLGDLVLAGLAAGKLRCLEQCPCGGVHHHLADRRGQAWAALAVDCQNGPTVFLCPRRATQPTSSANASSTACTIRCNKGCSYPGHCRRYVDTNRNNRCDLGECM